VVETMPAWTDDHPPRADFVFERADGRPTPDRRPIPERLFRRPMCGYRNSLPFAEDIAVVVLRTDRHVGGDTVDFDGFERTVTNVCNRFHLEGDGPYRD
jgi:hypothetical protein